jgi:hypothetical protein
MEIPPEFRWLRAGRRIAVVHDAVHATLGPLLLALPAGPPAGAVGLHGGRGGSYRLPLADGDSIVVRLYRRGGVIAHIIRETYFGWPPRPFLELVTTEEARRRGAPVPEVLGACIERRWTGGYRGAIVTRHLHDTETLWAALGRVRDTEQRRALTRGAAAAVRALHDAGIHHPDLNLNNCLVRRSGHRVEAFVIVLDRARATRAALGTPQRQRALRRLERSARKLDPEGKVIEAADLSVLRESCEVSA